MPIVIEIDGSSTVMIGSGTGFSASAKVSPIVMFSKPATAIISPGPADSAGTRSNAWVTKSSTTFAFSMEPSVLHQETVWPFLIVPL